MAKHRNVWATIDYLERGIQAAIDRTPMAQLDPLTEARRQAEKIQKYWETQGERASVWVERRVSWRDPWHSEISFEICSNLVGGLPRDRVMSASDIGL